MVHFLRTHDNITVVEADEYHLDFSLLVDVEAFARLLLNTNPPEQEDLIMEFSTLQELRGEWFETNPPGTMTNFIAQRFKKIGAKYNLGYVTD